MNGGGGMGEGTVAVVPAVPVGGPVAVPVGGAVAVPVGGAVLRRVRRVTGIFIKQR